MQGRTNPAFSKPCLFLSETRHFRHFRRFRWSEEPSPCFQWVECKFVIFAVFVKTAPFWQGTKARFTKNTVCATPTNNNKQLGGIVPEMGGGQIVYVFPFFLGKKGNT